MKTIVLIRHSLPDKTIKVNEDIPLSLEGIEKAKQFFKHPIFNKIHYIYSSTYLRAYQTAQILSNQIITDERLIERLIGNPITANKKQWKMQYDDHDYKNEDGESLNEVKKRMSLCIHDILEKMNENEVSVVLSHATSICSYLLNCCDIRVTNDKDKIRKITFNNKTIFEGRIEKPSGFIIEYEKNSIVDITYFE